MESEVEELVVTTIDEAQRLKFPGSPTIRIGGNDVEPATVTKESYGLG